MHPSARSKRPLIAENIVGGGSAYAISVICLPLFLALWLGHKLVTGSKPVRYEDADLTRVLD